MYSEKIILINPTRDSFKKESDRILKTRQLNFGLLSIASLLPENVIIYDCQGKTENEFLSEINSLVLEHSVNFVGISLISAYSEKCSFAISKELREVFPQVTIIIGGKDYAPYIAKYLLDFNHADIVVKGEGEQFFYDLLINKKNVFECDSIVYLSQKNEVIDKAEKGNSIPLTSYNHQLYPDYKDFVPSVEISRGCNKSCVFCTNNKIKQKSKKIKQIIEEISTIESDYQEDICIYFQTPHFLLCKNKLKELIFFRENHQKVFTWRTQTSVDYLSKENIDMLYRAGARAIDVGFESASLPILKKMEKTSQPQEYVDKMRRALEHSKEIGLRLKLNILFFVGENKESLLETFYFLKNNLYDFHSFSSYPVMFYPSEKSADFEQIIKNSEGKLNKLATSDNIFSVDLSRRLTYNKALQLAILYGKSLQSKEMYLAQREIAYFPKNYKAALPIEESNLPFYSSLKEKEVAKKELFNLLGEI